MCLPCLLFAVVCVLELVSYCCVAAIFVVVCYCCVLCMSYRHATETATEATPAPAAAPQAAAAPEAISDPAPAPEDC